jgi:diguanylate cyclase (GGDEF)-like protein
VEARFEGVPYSVAVLHSGSLAMAPLRHQLEELWNADEELQILVHSASTDGEFAGLQKSLGGAESLILLSESVAPDVEEQCLRVLHARWLALRAAAASAEELRETRAALLEMATAKEQAETAALQDPLTKLPNRRLFQSRLSLAIKHTERTPGYLCGLLYLDIDRFKIINDSLGHLAGDELLVGVAKLLENCLRRNSDPGFRVGSEDIVARLGGDEFAIFLDNIRDTSDALRIAERISEKLRTPIMLRGTPVAVTVSIGVALSASHYTSADSMLRDADIAMYRAKAAGRDACVLFDESMHAQALERLHREFELRKALDRREFFVCYQPIASLRDGHVEQIEALLRWRTRERGILIPEEFLPLAEETGLMIPVGAWALREACNEAARWRSDYPSGADIGVCVNISGRQLAQPDFAVLVRRILLDSGLSGRALRLEVSETVAMTYPERMEPVLEQLQELGVHLSIDDFGTGYSSLRQLQRFTMDTLKVDKNLILTMEEDNRILNIVRTIVALAHNLGMTSVAEGTETVSQVKLLQEMGCDCAQGHALARPLDVAGLHELLAARPELKLPLPK